MPEIRVEGLVHVYRQGGLRALDGVELRIMPGERVAIVGQNGSGKSTLVRHFNGLLKPTSGRVLLDGADTSRLRVAQVARSVGIVFQDPDRQIFARSVRGEVEFGPRNLGRAGAELRGDVDAALVATGLSGDESRAPYDLGRGRRKLLAIASVLAMRTPVLVLDEPTSGQDRAGMALVRGIVEAAARDGRTLIAVTHDMELVAEAFERIIVMRAGRVILDGSVAEAFAPASAAVLRSTHLDPPFAARVAARLGLAEAVTEGAVVAALRRGEPAQ